MDPDLLSALRALVDQHRLRIVARAAARPVDPETLAAELRQPLPAIRRHLGVLVAAGLVEPREARDGASAVYAARLDRVGELGRALAALERAREDGGSSGAGPFPAGPVPAGSDGPAGLALRGSMAGLPGAWPHDGEPAAETLARLALDADELRVLRSFLVDGRLLAIPAQHRKRQVVLRFLLERVFTEDREYPEREVNQCLALFHPDVAALRRYLVDDGYVDRERGVYRRRDARLAPPESLPG